MKANAILELNADYIDAAIAAANKLHQFHIDKIDHVDGRAKVTVTFDADDIDERYAKLTHLNRVIGDAVMAARGDPYINHRLVEASDEDKERAAKRIARCMKRTIREVLDERAAQRVIAQR